MSTACNPDRGLIIVTTRVFGPGGERVIRMAVDTGATTTTVRTAVLVALGYDPSASTERIAMTTASGVEYVPRIKVDRMEALGEHREPFTVIGHTLPPTAMVDGLLGLDFIRGRRIAIDFRDGHITME